jgi:O-antigen/teichoic acid export membrane protein
MILSSLQNPGVTGLYTVAFTVSGVLIAIVSVFSSALFPIVSELSSVSKARERQSYFITIVFRYALFLIIPISSLLLVFSNYVVLLLSEPSKIAAASFLPVLIPASVLFGLGGIFFASIYAIGKPKLQRNIILLVTILFLVLSVPLTIHYSALGLSVSYLISSFCYFILSYGFLYKHLKFKLYTKDILKIIFSSVLTVSFLFILKPFVHDIFTLFIVSIPMTLFYLVFLLLIKFYRIEDARLLRFFGRRIPGGKYLIALAGIIEKVTE